MMRRSSFIMLTFPMALALIVIACSENQTGSAPPAMAISPSTSSSTLESEKSPASSELQPSLRLTESEAEGAIYVAGFYSWERDEFEKFVEAEQEAAILQQDFIYSCMKTEGFEYFSEKVGQVSWLPWYSVDSDSREWVDVYGIGYSTTLLPQEVAGTQAVGYLGDPPPEPVMSEDSPESRYLASLSEEEYTQYALALTGLDPAELTEPMVQDGLDKEARSSIDESCQGRANAKFPVPDPVTYDDGSGELAQLVMASPEWINLVGDGWRCVRGAGIDAFSLESAEQLVAERLTKSGVAERLGELPRTLDPLPTDVARDLAGIQGYEREIAAALWDCGVHPIQTKKFFVELTRSFVVSR